jgi:hypothetical protein
MDDRDEEGRPKATRNAGAFLSPNRGVIPVPSSILDDYWDDRRPKRSGPHRTRWALAVAIAMVGIILILFFLTPDASSALATVGG